MNKRKKIIVGAAVTAGALAVATGVAIAAWTVNGTGTSTGIAAVAKNIPVVAVVPPLASATMYPGGPAGPVQFTLANPNPFAITITGYNWGTPLSANPSSCPSAQISLDANAPTTANVVLAANAPATTITVNGVLDLAHTAGDGCQGNIFNISLTVTGVQQ